jgi:formylglycine-generating enzyme required for sulfatase activity
MRSKVLNIAVSVTPITFAEWNACVRRGGCAGYHPDEQGWPDATPVVNVSYFEAQNYVRWLRLTTRARYRLVRENEWAWLATIGHTRAYPWGEAIGRGNTNCLDCGSPWDGISANPVRSFPADPHGLHDLVGNVAHWTEPSSVSQRARGRERACAREGRRYAAIFGAAWADPARYLVATTSTCFPKVLRDDTIGFRVVRELG